MPVSKGEHGLTWHISDKVSWIQFVFTDANNMKDHVTAKQADVAEAS